MHGYRPGNVEPTRDSSATDIASTSMTTYRLAPGGSRAGVVVFEHTMVDRHGVASPVVLLARSFAADDGEISIVRGELLLVDSLRAHDVDDWRLMVISAGLQVSRAAAADVLQWRRRNDPASTTGLSETLSGGASIKDPHPAS